jgi:hypothetical protein
MDGRGKERLVLRSRSLSGIVFSLLVVAGCNGARSGSSADFDKKDVELASPLLPGTFGQPAVFSLSAESARFVVAAVNVDERILIFDPIEARTAADVQSVPTAGAVTLNPPRPDTSGTPVSSLSPALTAAAAVAAGKLYVTTSNVSFSAMTPDGPGTVLIHNLASGARIDPVRRGAIPTTHFNPSAVSRFRTAGGRDLVLVVNNGSFKLAPTQSSIDVIDPARDAVVANIPVAADNLASRLALTADARAFLGSGNQTRVYEVDISDLDAAVMQFQGQPATLGGRVTAYDVPAAFGGFFGASLAVSADGARLYAANGGVPDVYELTISTPRGAVVNPTPLADARPNGQPFTSGVIQALALRPGTPGTSFTGPDIFLGIRGIAPPDQATSGVRAALDAVTSARPIAGSNLRQNAFTGFSTGTTEAGDIQDLIIAGRLALAVELKGIVRIVNLDRLP